MPCSPSHLLREEREGEKNPTTLQQLIAGIGSGGKRNSKQSSLRVLFIFLSLLCQFTYNLLSVVNIARDAVLDLLPLNPQVVGGSEVYYAGQLNGCREGGSAKCKKSGT